MEKTIQDIKQISGITDNWYLVLGNPDNTDTYKIKVSDFFGVRDYQAGKIETQLINSPRGVLVAGTSTSNNYTPSFDNREGSFIIGGSSNAGGVFSGGLIGGQSNSGSGNVSIVIGGLRNTLQNAYGGVIAGGTDNNITGGNDNGAFIAASNGSTSNPGSNGNNAIISSKSVKVRNDFSSGAYAPPSIISSYLCNIVRSETEDSRGDFDASFILGSKNSKIYGDATTSIPTRSSIINGDNCVISGLTGTTIIGIDSYTATTNNTTYVDNIHTLRTESFDTISGGSVSGNIDVDLSFGTIFKFEMTGNTTPNFINWREGQRMTFVVVNSGTYSVPTMTITGGGSVLVKGGSANPTNNGTTKYTGIIIDGDLYLNEELDFQAL